MGGRLKRNVVARASLPWAFGLVWLACLACDEGRISVKLHQAIMVAPGSAPSAGWSAVEYEGDSRSAAGHYLPRSRRSPPYGMKHCRGPHRLTGVGREGRDHSPQTSTR